MQHHIVVIRRVVRVSTHIVTLHFTLRDGGVLSYKPGQYITVFFKDSSVPSGKAYSLSSAPSESTMSLTVKRVGEYSTRLHALKVGDQLSISSAYGNFTPHTSSPLVCIGAGVGIAPLWSILKYEYRHHEQRLAQLFYSNQSSSEAAFKTEIDALSATCAGFTVHHYSTQCVRDSLAHHRRMCIDDCIQPVTKDATYLICGTSDFVRTMWQGLIARGVAKRLIYTEVFFEV